MSMRRRSPYLDGPNRAERIERIKGNMRMDRKPNATRISGNLFLKIKKCYKQMINV